MLKLILESVAIEVDGPTPEAMDALRADFERSALDWLEKASLLEMAGRPTEAALALRIGSIAEQVARGRVL
jgi:hypothetical protein